MATVLIIDDDSLVRSSLARLFQGMGHEVLSAHSLGQGYDLAAMGVDVIYLDLDLPDGDGLEAIDRLSATPGRPEVVVITGMGSSYGAQKTMDSGAWDYITKPATPTAVRESLEGALRFRNEARASRAVTEEKFDPCGMKSWDESMKRIMRDIEKAARSDASVLISGETGVGKELAARAIHANSRRKGKAFVVVDCSNVTDTLIESMLYGHVKGSFTGAHADHRGLVAEADGGTLFLDEVGELSPALQKSFLRILQERTYRPVGGSRELVSDFRLVAATNRDLGKMAAEGAFRTDLLFRLRTMEIVLPPLRDRGRDKELLAAEFINQYCDRYGLESKMPSQELFNVVRGSQWTGNVRELASVMEAAVINAGSAPTIYPKHLPGNVRVSFLRERNTRTREPAPRPETVLPQLRKQQSKAMPYREYKAACDKEYFARLLEETGHDISKVSKISGLSVPSVYRYLALAGIPTRSGRKG